MHIECLYIYSKIGKNQEEPKGRKSNKSAIKLWKTEAWQRQITWDGLNSRQN